MNRRDLETTIWKHLRWIINWDLNILLLIYQQIHRWKVQQATEWGEQRLGEIQSTDLDKDLGAIGEKVVFEAMEWMRWVKMSGQEDERIQIRIGFGNVYISKVSEERKISLIDE